MASDAAATPCGAQARAGTTMTVPAASPDAGADGATDAPPGRPRSGDARAHLGPVARRLPGPVIGLLDWSARPEAEHEKYSRKWIQEWLYKCVVFAITGKTSVKLVRPGLEKMGIRGSLREGPWSYRVLSVLLVQPIYTVILITVGTLFGRHIYFVKMAQKIWRRFLPASVVKRYLTSWPGATEAARAAASAKGAA